MGVLNSSLKDPNPKVFVPAEVANRVKVEESFDEMASRLESYQKYQTSPSGQIASQLADRQIEYLQHILNLSARSFCLAAQVPYEMVEETRAEYRGELRVWKLLKQEPERLQRLLNTNKEEAPDRGRKWKIWKTAPEKS